MFTHFLFGTIKGYCIVCKGFILANLDRLLVWYLHLIKHDAGANKQVVILYNTIMVHVWSLIKRQGPQVAVSKKFIHYLCKLF